MLAFVRDLNWLAVLLGTFGLQALGALWFLVLFGKLYARALGRDGEPPQKPAPLFIYGPLVCTLITTFTSAVLLRALHVASLADAACFGIFVGFGYLVATMTNTAINPNMPRPFLYSLVSGTYFLTGNVLVSVLLVAMR